MDGVARPPGVRTAPDRITEEVSEKSWSGSKKGKDPKSPHSPWRWGGLPKSPKTPKDRSKAEPEKAGAESPDKKPAAASYDIF